MMFQNLTTKQREMWSKTRQTFGNGVKTVGTAKEALRGVASKGVSLDPFIENVVVGTKKVTGSDVIFTGLLLAIVRYFIVTYVRFEEPVRMYILMFWDIYVSVIFLFGIILYFFRRYLTERDKE